MMYRVTKGYNQGIEKRRHFLTFDNAIKYAVEYTDLNEQEAADLRHYRDWRATDEMGGVDWLTIEEIANTQPSH